MGTLDKISKGMSKFGSTLASLVKITLQSKFVVSVPHVASTEELVILGNGPSLNTTVSESLDFLKSRQMLAVNFAVNTDLFFELKPQYYVLADPHFFKRKEQENVQQLWHNLDERVDWNMTLFIPSNVKASEVELKNTNIKVCVYNLTPVEGYNWFENWAYGQGLGSPRPRNVLIPSLMLAIRMNFKNIYLAGADHSWPKTLSVDDENHVVSIQPHFYVDKEKEQNRVKTDYMNYPLHQIMYSFYVAFKSYFTIQRFAVKCGIKVWNITPGSFIDAFPRKKITGVE